MGEPGGRLPHTEPHEKSFIKGKPGPLSKPGSAVYWRRGRDLNPRTGFKPRYPLSRRVIGPNLF